MQKTVLSVQAISKNFSGVKAVDNISFAVEQGDIYAFLGVNGAGKTTTLRILLDIIKADAGAISWNLGGKQTTIPPAERIGYLPEERGLYLDIPILKSLVYLASIRGMEPAAAKKAALSWLDRFGLAERANEKLQALSKGNQQKIQFIASILHQPEFAILDEPFSGLDPLNQELFIECIQEINREGTTILLSAHQMPLVEKIANKIFLINKGRELYHGSLAQIYQTFGERVVIELELEMPVLPEVFQALPYVESVSYAEERRVSVSFTQHTKLKEALESLIKIEGIQDITSRKPGLHEIFLQLVKKQ